MISNAFKSAYVNQVNAQNQGIDTITTGAKSAATAVLGIAGLSGGLGSGIVAKAAKYGLANKVGGVGGAIMMSTMEDKISSDMAGNLIASASQEDVSNAFKQMASGYSDRESIYQLDTVWNTIVKQREQHKQQEMLKKVEENLKGGNE